MTPDDAPLDPPASETLMLLAVAGAVTAIVYAVLAFGTPVEPRPQPAGATTTTAPLPWAPATNAPPVTTEVEQP